MCLKAGKFLKEINGGIAIKPLFTFSENVLVDQAANGAYKNAMRPIGVLFFLKCKLFFCRK